MWNVEPLVAHHVYINYCLCFEQAVEGIECHSKSKMANMWGHILQPNQNAELLNSPRGEAAPWLAIIATLLWRTPLVSPRPSRGSRVLVSVHSLCVVQRTAEELVIPNSKLVAYITTADIFRKNRPVVRQNIFWTYLGDSSTNTGSNLDFLWSCMRSTTRPNLGVSTVRPDGELFASGSLGF